jgi:hypothetical protein
MSLCVIGRGLSSSDGSGMAEGYRADGSQKASDAVVSVLFLAGCRICDQLLTRPAACLFASSNGVDSRRLEKVAPNPRQVVVYPGIGGAWRSYWISDRPLEKCFC